MATRSGLGGYVMGGYPQLVPSLYSLFYKVFPPSSAPSIPDVTHAIHFLNGLFNWLILPGGWLLCRKLKASFLLFTAIFFGNELFASEFASGYVDTATTAVFLCTAGLAAEWIDRGGTSRWPSAFVALLPASAALGFLKGQGFVLVGFVIVFTWAWSRSWKLNRSAPALLALACGTLPTFAFFAHQSATWEAGRVETELLLHTMPMQTGHPELVTRTWPHAMERMGNLLGGYVPAGFHAPPGYTVACIVLLIAAWVLALRKRAVIPVALAATAGWSLWFWNASYDGRNVHQVFALLAACMAAGLHFEAVSTRARRARASLHGLVVVAMSGHLLAACHPPSLASLTPSWRLTPAERPAAVFGPGCALLSASPLALQAEHIFSQNAFVWLLGDKTVYGWHPFVGSVPPAPGDLATVTRQGGRNTATSTGPYRFETVSGFGTQRLEMVRPDYASVPATVVRDGVSAASRPLPATITLPGVYWIHPEASVSGNDVVLFRVDIDCPGDTRPRTRMLVGREWNTLSSFRNLCYFIRDGDSFKALFWLDRVESGQSIPVLPPLAISKYDDQPITITGVHIRTIKSAAPGETLLP